MFCYAWHRFDSGPIIDVAAEDCPDLLHLFAKVLCKGTKRLIRKGLDRGYIPFEENIRGVRGRIDFSKTINKGLRVKSQIHCNFDDLDHDVLHNQILKTTLLRLLSICIDREIKEEIRNVYLLLDNISLIRLDKSCFRCIQLHRNNSIYVFLLKICELLHEHLLPQNGSPGKYKFYDIVENDTLMIKVFEQFVFNFYRFEQSWFSVTRDKIEWDFSPLNHDDHKFLPEMKTDVVLKNQSQLIIIDTKYYKDVFQKFHGVNKVHSENMYQMISYLVNLEKKGFPYSEASGILLYPQNDTSVYLDFSVLGHRIGIRTLNLFQPWQKIGENLLQIVAPY